ncbi:unnamed protein product [Absidia cylindrospora]
MTMSVQSRRYTSINGKKIAGDFTLGDLQWIRKQEQMQISFDHYKGTFGTVDMLKSIPDVKVFFFLHAEDKLHFWSLSFKHDGIYELWRETHLKIRPLFSDKADFMHDFMPFFWTMKMLRGTIDSIDDLAKSHAAIKAKHRYSSNAPVLLTSIITPSIIKLTQHEDSKGLADLGPFYSPFTSPLQSPNASPIHISETVTDDV